MRTRNECKSKFLVSLSFKIGVSAILVAITRKFCAKIRKNFITLTNTFKKIKSVYALEKCIRKFSSLIGKPFALHTNNLKQENGITYMILYGGVATKNKNSNRHLPTDVNHSNLDLQPLAICNSNNPLICCKTIHFR